MSHFVSNSNISKRMKINNNTTKDISTKTTITTSTTTPTKLELEILHRNETHFKELLLL